MKDKEFRCHPTIIVANSLKIVVLLIIFVLGDFSEMFLNQDGTYNTIGITIAFAVILTITAAYIISRFFAWKRTYILLTDENFIYDKRTLVFKRKVNVRLTRIATVNLEKRLLDRIFGTYTVKLDIDSSATAENTDFHLVFGEEFAKEFAEYIMSAKDGVEKINSADYSKATHPSIAEEIGNAGVTPILQFKIKNILIHSLLMTSAGSLIVFGALIAGVALPFAEPLRFLYPVIALAGLPVAFILSFLVSLVKNIFLYYNFTVSKKDGEVVVAYGLITRRIYRLPLSKTNGIVVKQSFFGRIFGMYYAEIVNVGMGDTEENIQPIFCLMLNKKQMEWTLSTLMPKYSVGLNTEKSPAKAFIPIAAKGLIISLFFAAVLVFMSVIFKSKSFVLISLVLLAFLWLLISFASYKAKGLSIYNDKLVIATGILSRRIIIVPFSKVQYLTVKSGPVSKRLNICHGSVSILSSIVNKSNYIGYFSPERFSRILSNTESVSSAAKKEN